MRHLGQAALSTQSSRPQGITVRDRFSTRACIHNQSDIGTYLSTKKKKNCKTLYKSAQQFAPKPSYPRPRFAHSHAAPPAKVNIQKLISSICKTRNPGFPTLAKRSPHDRVKAQTSLTQKTLMRARQTADDGGFLAAKANLRLRLRSRLRLLGGHVTGDGW